MSELCKKYDISEKSFKNMVNDGVISTSWPMYDALVQDYKMSMAGGMTQKEARLFAAEKHGISERQAYRILSILT